MQPKAEHSGKRQHFISGTVQTEIFMTFIFVDKHKILPNNVKCNEQVIKDLIFKKTRQPSKMLRVKLMFL